MTDDKKQLAPAVLSEEEYSQHIENNDGYCFTCKEWTDGGIEPDGCEYKCPSTECGQFTVFGAEELAVMALVEFI